MNLLLLLSGGFDSPVAGKLLIDRGVTVHALHYSSVPLTSTTSEEKSEHLARLIGCASFTIINISDLLIAIKEHCREEHYFIHMKRFMLSIAERYAKDISCTALITGDSIGQVGSQTLPNIVVITSATTFPILRPLLGKNKKEIIALAEKYGTFETSKGPETCDTLGPRHPATKAKQHIIIAEEKQLGKEQLIEEALKTKRVVDIHSPQRFKTASTHSTVCSRS